MLLQSKPEGKTSTDGPDLDCNLARSSPSLKDQSGIGKSCSQLPLAGDRPWLLRRPDKVNVVFSNVLAFCFHLVSPFDLFILYPLHLTWHTFGPRTCSAGSIKGSHRGKTHIIESQRVRFFEIIVFLAGSMLSGVRFSIRWTRLRSTFLEILVLSPANRIPFLWRSQGDIAFVAPLPSPRFTKDQARDAILPFFRQTLLESGRIVQVGQARSAGTLDKGKPGARTVKAELLRPPFKR